MTAQKVEMTEFREQVSSILDSAGSGIMAINESGTVVSGQPYGGRDTQNQGFRSCGAQYSGSDS